MATLSADYRAEMRHPCETCGQEAVLRPIIVHCNDGTRMNFVYTSHTFCTTCDDDIARQRAVNAAAHLIRDKIKEFMALPEEDRWLTYGMISELHLGLEPFSACQQPEYVKAFVTISVSGLKFSFGTEPIRLSRLNWARELPGIRNVGNMLSEQLKARADRGLPAMGGSLD